jgi:hypothetical protein
MRQRRRKPDYDEGNRPQHLTLHTAHYPLRIDWQGKRFGEKTPCETMWNWEWAMGNALCV